MLYNDAHAGIICCVASIALQMRQQLMPDMSWEPINSKMFCGHIFPLFDPLARYAVGFACWTSA